MIAEYADELAAALSFDRALARRLRREVEDHLWETVGADPLGDGPAAQRRAIASFGECGAIAAQFAAVSLARRIRRAGIMTLLAVAGVFIAMKGRVAWYALLGFGGAGSDIVLRVDRYAFWSAAAAGIAGWLCGAGAGRKTWLTCVLCAVATLALAVSVVSDAVLTAPRLPVSFPSPDALVPLASMTIEGLCAAVAIVQVVGTLRRAASTAALLKS